MKTTLFRSLILFVLFLVFALPAVRASANEGDILVVSPQGPYTSISAALDVAVDGDHIEVQGGQYSGPLVVDKSVSLEGVDWPVIDGNSQGTVVKLTAPDTHFKGFVIVKSGASLDEENSGIAGEAPNLTIENNRLEDTLFGIYLREAPGSNILNNIIQSKDLDLARRGDPIRVWYSNDVVIAENKVKKGRDVVLWYSENLTVRDNTITAGRYGLHFMYCDDATITNNLLAYNSVGTFMMYSRRLKLIHNTIAYNHGPSGFGIGLKDMDDAIVQDNLFLANRVGAHLDNSPREVDSLGTYQGNIFAYNDIGVNLMPSVRHNQFSNNSFIENQEQVDIGGGGMTQDNLWTVDGLGNFWSDYAGYDQAGDGLGDEVYRADRLFENLTSRFPNLRLFIFSPSSQAVDFAAKAVPFVRPQPKLTDSQPLMAPVFPTNLPALPEDADKWFLWVSAGLILLASTVFLGGEGLLPKRLKKPGPLPNPSQRGIRKDQKGSNPLIQVKQLTKSFKGLTVVDQLSFEIPAGQAVALWGPNGAGKTTSLRCLIGLLPFDGEITVNGIDVRRQGKTVRKMVGFVPQELAFHDDLSVQETMKFYARLKGVSTPVKAQIQPILAQVDLSGYESKLIRELSGGLKQRLALGIALLADPLILVLDEPTSNLDVHSRDDFLELLLELKASGMTLIFSSHRLEEIATLADRVLLLENGKLIADCPPDELSAQTGWNVTLRVLLEGRDLKPALDTLAQHGFVASPNGKGIRVKVTPGQKGRPLSVLTQAGIRVEDFEIEQLNGS
jgi:nitrous oxidase accessory protein